jgi:pyruvate kinase
MISNQSSVMVESESVSHSTGNIPAAWQTPPPARTEATNELENPETRTTLFSNEQPDKTKCHNSSRKTKIIATLGPATENFDVLHSVLESGVSVFRVNPACISRESALKAVYAIRSISTELQRPVSLLLDTRLSAGRTDSTGITETDWADIRFGLECGVDWLAVSASRDGDSVRQLRQFLTEQKRNNISVLARIETPATITALDQIIQDADGILLGEGSLVSERPTEMPCDWQLIVQKCVSARKLAVIATSVKANIASVLSAQPDALLMAEETSVGSNPLQSVQQLDGLIRLEESARRREAPTTVALTTKQDHTVASAVQQADELEAEAIVVFTRLGNSASLCAALRPSQSRVFAFTPDARLARRLRLRYALEPSVLSFSENPKKTIRAAEKTLLERKFLSSGAKVVFITDVLDEGERIPSVQLRTLD